MVGSRGMHNRARHHMVPTVTGQAIGTTHCCRCCRRCGSCCLWWCPWHCCYCWGHARLAVHGPCHWAARHGRLLLLLLLLLLVGHTRLAVRHAALLGAKCLLLLLRVVPGWG